MCLRFSPVLGVLICALTASGIVLAANQPNVLLIYTDDHGTLDAHCFGAADLHTPHIDRLATEGIRFTQAYAHTFCCPSRAALLTGRHPQRGSVNQWTQGDLKEPDKGVNMDLDEVTLAEVLQMFGYRTALFGKWHLGAHRDHGPTEQGFDEFFGIRGGFIDNHIHYFLQGDGYHDLYEGTEEVWAKGEYFPEMITERATAFIEENAKENRPFFLYLAFNTPHYPEQPLPEHLEMYPDLQEPRRTYAAFVTTTDAYIGQVLDQLDALGIRDDTIIVFMGDNGHQSYESYDFFQILVDDHASGLPKGHRFSSGDGPNPGGGYTGKWIGHKGLYLEGGIRVPAILSYPARLPKGIVRDQAVTAMDWFPTILDLCGIGFPGKSVPIVIDGRSLVDVARSAEASSPHPVLYFQWQNKWAVREGDWKLIRLKGNRETAKETFSLHNLADLEPEATDYIDAKPAIVARLKSLHGEWERDVFDRR